MYACMPKSKAEKKPCHSFTLHTYIALYITYYINGVDRIDLYTITMASATQIVSDFDTLFT